MHSVLVPFTDSLQREVSKRKQKTLGTSVALSGIGIHTGEPVSIRFCPAPVDNGVTFCRVDLPEKPIIPANVEYVFDTSRSTNIGKEQVKIYTVEHVLAALYAYEIDNVCIEISSIEPPAGNGSSDVFVEMIEQAAVVEQDSDIAVFSLDTPIFWSEGDVHLVALPSNEYRVSYTLHYPQAVAIGSQYFSLVINKENFKKEIARCRTFALYEEISMLIDKGLIKGGSLDNAVIIKEGAILSKDGLFSPDEMVRHKVLDMIGDLSLVGVPFLAHIIAIRSGHASNYAFAKQLYSLWRKPHVHK